MEPHGFYHKIASFLADLSCDPHVLPLRPSVVGKIPWKSEERFDFSWAPQAPKNPKVITIGSGSCGRSIWAGGSLLLGEGAPAGSGENLLGLIDGKVGGECANIELRSRSHL